MESEDSRGNLTTQGDHRPVASLQRHGDSLKERLKPALEGRRVEGRGGVAERLEELARRGAKGSKAFDGDRDEDRLELHEGLQELELLFVLTRLRLFSGQGSREGSLAGPRTHRLTTGVDDSDIEIVLVAPERHSFAPEIAGARAEGLRQGLLELRGGARQGTDEPLDGPDLSL